MDDANAAVFRFRFFSFFLFGTRLPGMLDVAKTDPILAAEKLAASMVFLYTFATMGEIDGAYEKADLETLLNLLA